MFPLDQLEERDMARDETDSERQSTGPGDAPGLEAFNALLRRTLAMPPKPHSEMKLGRPRGRGASRRPREGTGDKDAVPG
jgi:hypothetical protein